MVDPDLVEVGLQIVINMVSLSQLEPETGDSHKNEIRNECNMAQIASSAFYT